MTGEINPNNFCDSIKIGVIGISVYYEISDLVDQKTLIEEGKRNNLKIEFLKGALEGLVKVSLIVIPLGIDSLREFNDVVGRLIKEPLKIALRNADNKGKISSFLKKTNYIKHFCQLAILVNKRIREDKENLNSLRIYLQRYIKFLGSEGIELFIRIFNKGREEQIIDGYSEYQEFILKKFQIELFISQQINQNYLTLISLNPKHITKFEKEYKINIPGLNNYKFEQVNWHHAFLEKRAEIYITKNEPNLFIWPLMEPTNKVNEALLGLKLWFQNINSGLNLMGYVLEQEDQMLEEEFENFPTHIASIRNNIQTMGIVELKENQEFILAYLNSINSTKIDIYHPIKKEFKNYIFKKGRIDKMIEDKNFTQPLIDGKGMQYAVKKLNLPTQLGIQLPSTLVVRIYYSIVRREKKLDSIEKEFRALLKETEELKHIKEVQQQELNEVKQKEIAAREAKVMNRISFIIDTIVKILEFIKPGQ
ncbi:hypothetical protein KY347_04110 [Candidatus Woesearchaeota archaeon]|nr:hypothetical protein [Candidatus Woesearchaeota archaeon]